jgi:hypothetical protein
MATAEQIAIASLSKILVGSQVLPPEPEDLADFIFEMNNYMLALDADGIQLGYTVITSSDEDVTIPTGALRGVIANMAIEVSPAYRGTITPGLQRMADEGMKTMRHLGVAIGRSFYPSTLPVGSGNEHDTGFSLWSHFYPDQEAEILAETTGSISLEIDTNTVANQ